jgi:cytochrome c oxidase cbb3-type subunit 4
MTMDIDLMREVVTVLSFLSFLGIVAYAVHPANRERFEKAAMSPLEDDENHE